MVIGLRGDRRESWKVCATENMGITPEGYLGEQETGGGMANTLFYFDPEEGYIERKDKKRFPFLPTIFAIITKLYLVRAF